MRAFRIPERTLPQRGPEQGSPGQTRLLAEQGRPRQREERREGQDPAREAPESTRQRERMERRLVGQVSNYDCVKLYIMHTSAHETSRQFSKIICVVRNGS